MPLDNPWASVLGMVIVVAVVIVLSYLFTRYIVGGSWARATGFPRKNEGLSVLVQTPIGKDQRLAVVQAGGRYFLVGITPQNISMLAELTEEESAAWMEKTDGQGSAQQGVPFRQAFMDALQRGKKR